MPADRRPIQPLPDLPSLPATFQLGVPSPTGTASLAFALTAARALAHRLADGPAAFFAFGV